MISKSVLNGSFLSDRCDMLQVTKCLELFWLLLQRPGQVFIGNWASEGKNVFLSPFIVLLVLCSHRKLLA